MPLGTQGSFPSFPSTPLPASQDEASWITSTTMTLPSTLTEGPTPTTSTNSYGHAANPSTSAQSARNLVMTVATAGGTSVGDATSGDRDTQPPTAQLPRRKRGKRGKGARNGPRQWRTGEWIGRPARRDGQMPLERGRESPVSQTKTGWGPGPPLLHHPPSLTSPTSSASSAARHRTPPSSLSWTSSMSVTSNIKWGVMLQTFSLRYGQTIRHSQTLTHS